MTWKGQAPVAEGSNHPKLPLEAPSRPHFPWPPISVNPDCSQMRVPIGCFSQFWLPGAASPGILGFLYQLLAKLGRDTSMTSSHPSPSTSYGYSAQSPREVHV